MVYAGVCLLKSHSLPAATTLRQAEKLSTDPLRYVKNPSRLHADFQAVKEQYMQQQHQDRHGVVGEVDEVLRRQVAPSRHWLNTTTSGSSSNSASVMSHSSGLEENDRGRKRTCWWWWRWSFIPRCSREFKRRSCPSERSIGSHYCHGTIYLYRSTTSHGPKRTATTPSKWNDNNIFSQWNRLIERMTRRRRRCWQIRRHPHSSHIKGWNATPIKKRKIHNNRNHGMVDPVGIPA
jgi:hypothetical protein